MWDQWIKRFDQTLKHLHGLTQPTQRNYPAAGKMDSIEKWSLEQKRMSQWQMRINHTGEVCAQALYAGHLIVDLPAIEKEWLIQTAQEEEDHLQWCKQRLGELGTTPSLLNPCFYIGSFFLGASFAICGKGWNYGLLAETEDQVSEHLLGQRQLLEHDESSLAIIDQMRSDEQSHAQSAKNRQAQPLPKVVKALMRHSANMMKSLVRWL